MKMQQVRLVVVWRARYELHADFPPTCAAEIALLHVGQHFRGVCVCVCSYYSLFVLVAAFLLHKSIKAIVSI